MSTDLHTLSGAYALDALSSEEAEQFREHLVACPACREEVRELQRAAATMGADEAVPPPPYLKAKVLAAADRTPQLPPLTADGSAADATEADRSPRRWGSRLLMAAAVAVLVAAGAVGVSQLQGEPEAQLAAGVVRVFAAEDAATATVTTQNGGRVAIAISPGLGQMAVDTDELPPLGDGRVYQLWSISGGVIASAGVLEREKGASMRMPGPGTEVAITVEPAGGSTQPTTEPILRVDPSQV